MTLVGHSERRSLFKENHDMLLDKTKYSLQQGISVVFCCGEQLEDREADKTEEVIENQLKGLESISKEHWNNMVIAYEPVWAIGTGKVASDEQAQAVHKFIREWVSKNVSEDVASKLRIIYGGSVKKNNCQNLIKMEDIDGFLIGGASLNADFAQIVNKSH